MLGGELVTLAPQLVVVRQVGSAAARAPGRHVVGEQPGEPETVVAQMHAQQEPALAGVVQAGEIRHQVDEIGVALVVGAADPRVAVVIAELEHEGSEVFRELAVVDACSEQGVAHRHVREQQRRRHRQRTQGQQGLEQAGLVQQPVGAVLKQQALVARPSPHVAAREGERHQAKIGCPQTTADRSEEHTSELQSPCNLVCRLLLEKKKKKQYSANYSQSSKVNEL